MMMNVRAAAQDANYSEWFALTLAAAVAAFPILWAFAWRRFSDPNLKRRDRLRLSAKVAAKAILPLWALTAVVGFFVVMAGVIVFMWLYAFFLSPPGGTNLAENLWIILVPYVVLFTSWYIFSLVCVIRWLPKSPDERFIM